MPVPDGAQTMIDPDTMLPGIPETEGIEHCAPLVYMAVTAPEMMRV